MLLNREEKRKIYNSHRKQYILTAENNWTEKNSYLIVIKTTKNRPSIDPEIINKNSFPAKGKILTRIVCATTLSRKTAMEYMLHIFNLDP